MKKRSLSIFISLLLLSVITSSCATIIGGRNYNAKVKVLEHPDAKIEYEGDVRGVGQASFKAARGKANDFSVTISKEGCDSQTIHFNGRKFRGWAFVGTLGWTGISSSGIPLPWGIAVDGITEAWWKPDINEIGVSKQDYNHYIYEVNYTGCDNPNTEETKEQDKNIGSKAERLRELKKLLDEGVITKKEFEIEKNKILNEN